MTQEQIEAVRAAAIEAVQSAANLGPIDARLVPVIEGLVRTAGDLGKVANALTTRLSEVERERDEARAEVERLKKRLEIPDAPFEYYDGIVCRDETIRLQAVRLDQARADLATLRAAVDEAVSELENLDETFDYAAFCRALDTLRNLTKPDTPSERIMSDKDRENPVEGAHPTQPEGEDALVEAWTAANACRNAAEFARWLRDKHMLLVHTGPVEALASRGLVRGEGVEHG